MLVLTRRTNERILIGDDISVEVLTLGPGKVKLGITAPREMNVDREEIREAKLENARAEMRRGLAR